MITIEQLLQAAPKVKAMRAALFLPHLNSAMREFNITTPKRQAAFLANVLHESGYLSSVSENLNYRAETLMKVWPKRFPTIELANKYAHSPERLANLVYADRMGNRGEASGDGFKFIGSGLIQLTGKNNQYACALYFCIDLEGIGEWLRSPEGASRSAAWYWDLVKANVYADSGDFDGTCDIVNIGRKTATVGDSVGYADRLKLFNSLRAVLGE